MSGSLNLSVVMGLKDQLSPGLSAIGKKLDGLGKPRGIELSLQDQLSAGLDSITDKLQGLGEAGLALTAVGVGMLAMMRPPIIAFMESEDAATRLKVAMMQAGGVVPDTFQQISDAATEMGNRLPGSTADFQDMMATLIKQGVDAQTILGGTGEAAAQLGVILEMSASGAAEFVAQLQDATQTSAKDMVALGDTIQRTFHLGVGPGNMLQAFASLAPGMAAIKQQGLAGANAMAPLIAMLDQATLKGSAAGIALSKIFLGGFDAKKVGDANKLLGKTGIKLNFVDKKGEFIGLENLFTQLGKLSKLSTQQRSQVLEKLFGNDDAVSRALNTLIEKGQAGYDERLAAIKAQASQAERIKELLNTLTNLWDAAAGTFTNAMADFGASIEPELKGLTKWFNDTTVALQGFMKAHPVLTHMVAQIGLFGGMAALGLGAVATSLAGVGGVLGMLGFGSRAAAAGAGGAGAGGSRLGRVLRALLHPVQLLRTALLALVSPWALVGAAAAAAAFAVYKYWGPIKGFFKGLWAGFKEGMDEAFGPGTMKGIETTFGNAMDGIKMAAADLSNWFATNAPGAKKWLSELTQQSTDEAGGEAVGKRAGRSMADFAHNVYRMFTNPGELYDQRMREMEQRMNAVRNLLERKAGGGPALAGLESGAQLGPAVQTLTTAADTQRQAAGQSDQAAGRFDSAVGRFAQAASTPINGTIDIRVHGQAEVTGVQSANPNVTLRTSETRGPAMGAAQ